MSKRVPCVVLLVLFVLLLPTLSLSSCNDPCLVPPEKGGQGHLFPSPEAHLVLFIPGLSPADLRARAEGEIHVRSPFPSVSFADFLTGRETHGLLGQRFYHRGRRIYASHYPLPLPVAFFQEAPPNSASWSLGRESFRGHSVERRYHLYKSPMIREEEVEWGRPYTIFLPPRGRSAGARWDFWLERSPEGLEFHAPEPITYFRGAGGACWGETITLGQGESLFFLLRYGGRPYFLHLRLVSLEPEGPVFYRMGPVRGRGAPWPDFTGLRRQLLSPEEFAVQCLQRLRAQTRWLSGKGPGRHLVYVDYFSLLASGIEDHKQVFSMWQRAGISLLKELVAGYRERGGLVSLIGLEGGSRGIRRLNPVMLLRDPQVIALADQGAFRLYAPRDLSSLKRRVERRLQEEGIGGEVRFQEQADHLLVHLPKGFEAGYCPRRRVVCEGSETHVWGGADLPRGWFSTDRMDLPKTITSMARAGQLFGRPEQGFPWIIAGGRGKKRPGVLYGKRTQPNR